MPAEQTGHFHVGRYVKLSKRELPGSLFHLINLHLHHLWGGLREEAKFKIIFLLHLFSE